MISSVNPIKEKQAFVAEPMYVHLHLEWLVLNNCFLYLLCTRVGDRLCGLINGNSLRKEEKHMIAVHDYRKPLVGHHSPIVHKERKAPLTLCRLHFWHCRYFLF